MAGDASVNVNVRLGRTWYGRVLLAVGVPLLLAGLRCHLLTPDRAAELFTRMYSVGLFVECPAGRVPLRLTLSQEDEV